MSHLKHGSPIRLLAMPKLRGIRCVHTFLAAWPSPSCRSARATSSWLRTWEVWAEWEVEAKWAAWAEVVTAAADTAARAGARPDNRVQARVHLGK
jgi:hypothetical protein